MLGSLQASVRDQLISSLVQRHQFLLGENMEINLSTICNVRSNSVIYIHKCYRYYITKSKITIVINVATIQTKTVDSCAKIIICNHAKP